MINLSTLRKSLDRHDCRIVKFLATMFAIIAEKHPDVVKETFSNFLQSKTDDEQDHQITLLIDEAAYIKELFDIN